MVKTRFGALACSLRAADSLASCVRSGRFLANFFDQSPGQISISCVVKYLTGHLVKMGGVVDGDGRRPVGRLQLRYYKCTKYGYYRHNNHIIDIYIIL